MPATDQSSDAAPASVGAAKPSAYETPGVELSPHEAKQVADQQQSRPPWYDRLLGTRKPSTHWNDAIDDVVDGVDYGETPLPWEQRDTWPGYLLGPGLHYFRKLMQMPLVRVLNWPLLALVDLGWFALRGLAVGTSEAAARFNTVGPLAEHSERLRRVREISLSDPARIQQAVQDATVFGVPPGSHLLRQIAERAGMMDNKDLDRPEVYREFVGAALSNAQFLELLHRALGEVPPGKAH